LKEAVAVVGCYLSFILLSLFFLWPFLTTKTRGVEWELRDSPLGLIVLEKSWDNLLIWPSLGFPAFVEPGRALEVWVLCRWTPQVWWVHVDSIPLRVVGRTENMGIWKLTVQLPENLGDGLHDLWVEADGGRIGEKKGRNSLMVTRNLPSAPRIAVVSDTHVDEENWRVVRFAINPRPLFTPEELQNLPAPLRDQLESLNEAMSRVKDGVMVCRPQIAQKLSEALAYIRENIKPDLVLIPGDLVDWSADGNWEKLWEVLASSQLPVCLVPGNHDHYGRIPALFQGRKWLAPFYRDFVSFDVYGFRLGGYYLVGINSGHDWKPFDSGGGSGLENAQLYWLLDYLREKENIILFLHHPSKENQLGLAYGWENVLSQPGVSLVVCGHTHPPVPTETWVRGVRQIEVPAIRDTQEPAQAVVVLSLPTENVP
jgi:metallophosphoesterase superfamily enzyme